MMIDDNISDNAIAPHTDINVSKNILCMYLKT